MDESPGSLAIATPSWLDVSKPAVALHDNIVRSHCLIRSIYAAEYLRFALGRVHESAPPPAGEDRIKLYTARQLEPADV